MEMVGISDFQELEDPWWWTKNKMPRKSAKQSYKVQATPLLIYFSWCGSSESIKPDEWFQIFWYFCDQAQRVLRWEEQKRRRLTEILFELVVSMTIPNHLIQFWIQFKTPHSSLQGPEKAGPSPPERRLGCVRPPGRTPWLTVLSVSRLFLKKLSKGDFVILFLFFLFFLFSQRTKSIRYIFFSPSPNIPLKFT